MKKTLVALAALASVSAFAQSSVEIYGIIDQSVAQTTVTQDLGLGVSIKGKIRNTGVQSGLATQRIGFRGTEDLGGGTKALFQIENSLSAGAAGDNGFGSRPTFVGLSGSAGTLTLGRQDTPMLKAVVPQLAGGANNAIGQIMWSPFAANPATLAAAPAAATGFGRIASQTTIDRAVNYLTPTMGGLSAEVQFGQNATKVDVTNANGDYDSTTDTGANIKYANGPLTLNAATHVSKNMNNLFEAAKTRNNYAGATYALGSTVLSLQHGTDRRTDATAQIYKNRGTQVGVKTPLSGAISAFGSYGMGKRTFGEGDGADIVKQRSYQLGLGYGFSKRTTAYAAIGNQKLKGANENTTGFKYKENQYVIGLNHSF